MQTQYDYHILPNPKSMSLWFKHILLINTKGSGVTKLRRKPSPTYTHKFTPLNTYYQEMRYQITYTMCIP